MCPTEGCTNPATHEHKGVKYCFSHWLGRRQYLFQPKAEEA